LTRPAAGNDELVSARTATDASPYVPASTDLTDLSAAAAGCHGCELYERATQTVFGEGPRDARVLLVGEQPGDVEDREGEPFVGPAGRLLDRALSEAGLVRSDVYVTNAVKHFRWKSTETGKRRLHQKPDARHVAACVPWLRAEVAAVRPSVLVALGATAGAALFGTGFRLTQHRGEVLDWPPEHGPFADADPGRVDAALATIHPSAVLRGPSEARHELYDGLVADLRLAVR
jgi:DNA polymerase